MANSRKKIAASVKEQRRRRNQSRIMLNSIPLDCGKPALVVDVSTIKNAEEIVVGKVSNLLDPEN